MVSSNKNSPPPSDTPPESDVANTVLRRRAWHRLIGAALLVLVGVLVLPWVFDSKPPKLSPDIRLRIDGKKNTEALPVKTPETVVAQASQATTPKHTQPITKPSVLEITPQPKTPAKNQATKELPQATEKPAPKLVSKPEPAPIKKQPQTLDELIAQRTKKSATKKSSGAVNIFPEKGRFVVQVGAYTDAERVRKIRQTLNKAGLKSYIQNIEIKGKTITRVRLGPFSTRKQLDNVAAKVRALGLNASLYSL